MKKTNYLFFLLSTSNCLAFSNCDHLPPPGISPLFSFGHTILPKKTIAVSEEVIFIKQKPHSGLLTFITGYYGISKYLSLISSLPFYNQKTVLHKKQTGIGDYNVNINYLLYKNSQSSYRYRSIALAGIRFPTTTVEKGSTLFTLGTHSFFLGITQDALTPHWYCYSDFGILLTTKHSQRKFGNTVLFNLGLGKIFCIQKSYLTIFLELSDFYSVPDKIKGNPDLTTGGNLLFVGPTLRYEFKNFLFQMGIQFDVAQNIRGGPENNFSYILGFFAAYTF